jgi:hypothetical protein
MQASRQISKRKGKRRDEHRSSIQPFARRSLVALELAHGGGNAFPQKVAVDVVLRKERVGAQARDEAGVAAVFGDEGAGGAPYIAFDFCHATILEQKTVC